MWWISVLGQPSRSRSSLVMNQGAYESVGDKPEQPRSAQRRDELIVTELDGALLAVTTWRSTGSG